MGELVWITGAAFDEMIGRPSELHDQGRMVAMLALLRRNARTGLAAAAVQTP